MGIRVGVRFEGIRVVDGLLDVQPFRSRVSEAPAELASHAQTRPLHPPFPQIRIFTLKPQSLNTSAILPIIPQQYFRGDTV
jgi:hypothetical protein